MLIKQRKSAWQTRTAQKQMCLKYVSISWCSPDHSNTARMCAHPFSLKD